jgi:hypothetical protein
VVRPERHRFLRLGVKVRGVICEGNGVRNSGMGTRRVHAFTCGLSRVLFSSPLSSF